MAFLTNALTMSALMFLLAFAIALAQENLVARLRVRAGRIKKWGGRIMVLVGMWLIILAIWADFFGQLLPN